jgi:hypothetical protein
VVVWPGLSQSCRRQHCQNNGEGSQGDCWECDQCWKKIVQNAVNNIKNTVSVYQNTKNMVKAAVKGTQHLAHNVKTTTQKVVNGAKREGILLGLVDRIFSPRLNPTVSRVGVNQKNIDFLWS